LTAKASTSGGSPRGKPALTGDSMKTKSKTKSVAKKAAAKILNVVKKSAGKLAASRGSPPKAVAKKPAAKASAKPVAAKAGKPGPSKKPAKPFDPALMNSMTEAQIRRMSPGDYMNDVQLEFFRRRLLQMREEVLAREVDVKERLHQREVFADPADRASAEEEHWLDLRLRERESLLLRKIEEALRRIKDKEYGYCEVTGEPIGIPRLLARPTATVCVDVKGHNEQIESQFRDR
jgi:DnaK suppressor protein